MKIQLSEVGKRYNQEWIFKNLNLDLHEGNAYVVLGSNGSGKSTLMQVIAGNQLPSVGSIAYKEKDALILPENIFSYLSYAAPYLELIEEYTLREMCQFHLQFKTFRNNMSCDELIQAMHLEKAKNKEIRNFSSGMKQRLRLALAIFSESAILFLDEPTSNLDKSGVDWYNRIMQENIQARITLVASNHQSQEYGFCNTEILVEQYKN
jgi:ABC-type multidrug transport system ATPase subunit